MGLKRMPKYLEKLLEVLESKDLKLGTVNHVSIKHDDTCGIFQGGECDCEPDIEFLGREQWPDD